MDKVIVIGCYVPGYAVIRALAGRDIEIIAMTYATKDVAQWSRYISEIVNIPVPEDDEQRFIDLLMKNASRWEGALILETSDNVSIALSRHKELLSKCYRIVTPDPQAHRIFMEKERTYELAGQCDVPFPRSAHLARVDDLEQCSDISYPCILKPVRSFEFITRFHTKNFEVGSKDEAAQKLKLCADAGITVVLQEIIPGPDDNLFKLQGYVNSKGHMVGKFFNRKLRQHPAHFGVMRVGVSTERNPEVEQLTQRLLTAAGYKGYFSIEFKKDPRDGQLKLMENNCRMPRSGMLSLASGMNHPWIIFQDLVRGQQIDMAEYKVGTYWIELSTDIPDSLFLHRQEQIRLGDYLKPYLARNKVFADLDLRDLRPFLRLAGNKFRGSYQRHLVHRNSESLSVAHG